MAESFPDVEEGIRTYLRQDVDVQAGPSAGRVFFGVPRQNPVFPLITLRRAGGGDDLSEAPIDQAVISFSCWGGTKQQAWDTAASVRLALYKIRGKTLVSAGVYAHGAQVDGVIFSPDPADDRPRYVVTSRVTATAA